jgi:hypothetical protein
MTDLIAAHQHLLQQTASLLGRLDQASYTAPSPVFLNSAIGGHVRHCLEHYESLLKGWQNGRIDYDARSRDRTVETQPSAARARLDSICAALEKLDERPILTDPCEILVRSAHGRGEGEWHASSLGRELQFLISHTVHHYALMAGLCHLQGIPVAPGFGVAPSTLRYLAANHA